MIDRLRSPNEKGAALPSPVVILSILAVVVAAVAFFVTLGGEPEERAIDPAANASETAAEEPTEETSTEPVKKKKKKPVIRNEVPVVVFNNTNIAGLASRVTGTVQDIGWQIVGADNWYGTIPATTVYYGPGMKRAANQLALDLGVERVLPAVETMSSTNLTLILTGEL